MSRAARLLTWLNCFMFVLLGCMVGPDYQRPTAQVPAAYKELLSAEQQASEGWKIAQPNDAGPRGPWWEVFQDARLNDLEARVDVSNHNIATAEARLRGARAAIRVARGDLFPLLTGGAAIERARTRSSASGDSGGQGSSPRTRTIYQIPLDFSYDLDVWGQTRRNIEANTARAEATAADLETVRLNMHAELAATYYVLRGLDTQKQLLDLTVSAFERALELTLNRYNQGIVSQLDVAQARTQLEITRAQAIDVSVQRAQLEHAIALLVGQPPAEFSIPSIPISAPPPEPLTIQPPTIPAGLPSDLLERRPDIAAAERSVAAANEQIGIATAAFFPNITLTGSIGVSSSRLSELFSMSGFVWSLGAAAAEIIFEGGRRKALTEQAQAAYDATVSIYRQTVLSALQDVEDNLAALRLLEAEALQQQNAVKAAETALTLALNRYKGGVTTYLEVITAQAVTLAAERAAIDVLTRRMAAAVRLIQALGGSWTEGPTAASSHPEVSPSEHEERPS